MRETWKNIPNYNGYQVSNLGRVRTNNKITHTDKHGDRHWKNRILKFKGKPNKSGYRVDLWKNGKPKTFLVARLVAFTFYDKNIENHNLTVNHIDGNRLNNNLSNLELITLKENIQHAFRTGLQNQIKVKIEDKITGTIIYPSSLSEGSKLIKQNVGYLSMSIKRNKYENARYKWELI
mgnify:CR=1 FL=1